MLSYRRQQCWISFDAKRKAMDHSADAACNARPMPQERVMSLEQEEEIERCSMNSEEDTWWWLFQQLIPGMRECSLDQLKQRYSPCKLPLQLHPVPNVRNNFPDYRGEISMTIPPVNLWGLSFSPAHLPGPSPSDGSLVSTSYVPDLSANQDLLIHADL
jgi:hypothetical protein